MARHWLFKDQPAKRKYKVDEWYVDVYKALERVKTEGPFSTRREAEEWWKTRGSRLHPKATPKTRRVEKVKTELFHGQLDIERWMRHKPLEEYFG